MGEIIAGLIGLVLGGGLYLLPAIVAQYGDHKHTAAIWTLNILLGWTGLGWVIALVWAMMDQTRPPRRRPSSPQEKTLEEMLAEDPGGAVRK